MPPPPPGFLRQLPALRRALRTWFRAQRRDLPWRTEPTLYKTVVSEFMLQQTQVKTVLPYFARWLEQFPGFAALAAAGEEQVVRAWEGLGYYSRARNLHRLAQAVAAMPAPPRTAAEWSELPGVGPYTAAAIASIACGDAAACVDGNVVRVLARLTADDTAFADNAKAVKHFAPLAAAVLDPAHPGEHNEAMMELGATHCLPKAPACLVCPVRDWCASAAAGGGDRPRIARRATERRVVWRAWCRDGDRVLLHRAPAGSRRLAGLHELPTAEQLGWPEARLAALPVVSVRRRGITHHLIEERIVAVPSPSFSEIAASAALRWVDRAELAAVTLSGPHRRWLDELLSADAAAAATGRTSRRARR